MLHHFPETIWAKVWFWRWSIKFNLSNVMSVYGTGLLHITSTYYRSRTLLYIYIKPSFALSLLQILATAFCCLIYRHRPHVNVICRIFETFLFFNGNVSNIYGKTKQESSRVRHNAQFRNPSHLQSLSYKSKN